jgi:hypothetical protein
MSIHGTSENTERREEQNWHAPKHHTGTVCPVCGKDNAISDEGTWEICPHLLLEVDVTFPYACGTDCPCEPVGLGTIQTEWLVALNEAVRGFFAASAGDSDMIARCAVSFPPNLAALVSEVEQGVSVQDGVVTHDDYVDMTAFAGMYHRVMAGCTGYVGWTSWVQDIPMASSEYWMFWATDGERCAADFHERIAGFAGLLWDAAQDSNARLSISDSSLQEVTSTPTVKFAMVIQHVLPKFQIRENGAVAFEPEPFIQKIKDWSECLRPERIIVTYQNQEDVIYPELRSIATEIAEWNWKDFADPQDHFAEEYFKVPSDDLVWTDEFCSILYPWMKSLDGHYVIIVGGYRNECVRGISDGFDKLEIENEIADGYTY